jgi:hypothetical protein
MAPFVPRIRRRAEAVHATDPAIHADAAPTPESTPQDSSINPEITFQERIILERQRQEDGPSPP